MQNLIWSMQNSFDNLFGDDWKGTFRVSIIWVWISIHTHESMIELTILMKETLYYLLEMVEKEALTMVENRKTECINQSSMNS